MAGKSWNVLGRGPGQDLVLAVDFSSTGRPMAGFRDLVPLLDPPLTVWETAAPAGGAVPPAGYVDWWLVEVERSGRPVRAVVGYCAGAVLAAQIAAQIAARHDAPRLVLFDPELPNTAGLHRDFHAAGDSMAAMMAPGELDRYHAAAERVRAEFGDDDVLSVGSALDEVFTATMTGIAERIGLDNEVRDELAGVFGTLVQYLAAAQLFDPHAMWARSTAIRSTGAAAVEVGGDVVLDVSHDDLLRHTGAARALSDLLGTATARDLA